MSDEMAGEVLPTDPMAAYWMGRAQGAAYMEAEKAQQLAILGDAVASFLVEVGLFRNVGLTGPELLLGLQDATATMKIQAAQLEAVMRVPTDYRAELAELYRDGGERIPFAMSTAALIRTRMDQKYEELARG